MHWLHLWKACIGTAWDWVIDLRGSGLSYGLRTQKRSIWKQIPNDPRHKVEQLCACLGIPLYGTKLWFSKEKETLAEQLIQKPTLALAPAANWVGKQWPILNFQAISEQFLNQFPGANIAVFCAPHERESLKPLLDAIDPKRLYDFTQGQYGLSQAGALIQACHLFLGNDSGLMHMSAAVSTPTIGLFGPSRENNYGPFEMPSTNPTHRVMRIPLSYDELSQQDGFSHKAQTCFMEGLNSEDVWNAIQDKWESANTN
jgi:ADP-heptose:LPS heptosyltransferase